MQLGDSDQMTALPGAGIPNQPSEDFMRPTAVLVCALLLLALTVAGPSTAQEPPAPATTDEKSFFDRIGDAAKGVGVAVGDFFLAGRKIEDAEKTQAPANAYDKMLFEGYVKLSRTEYDEGDYVDSASASGRKRSAPASCRPSYSTAPRTTVRAC